MEVIVVQVPVLGELGGGNEKNEKKNILYIYK